MTRGRSLRKPDQKGVEAIFSSSKEQSRTRVILGAIAMFSGISFIIVSVIMVQFPSPGDQSAAAAYGSLGFASIGVFVLTCGVGIVISGFQLSYSRSSRAILDRTSSVSLPTSAVEDTSALSPARMSRPNLRLGIVAFLQGIILLSLYAGLVEEYQSNPTMQIWVRSSLDSAQYLLTWVALLVSSFLVGILAVYSLVTRDLVE